MNIAIPLFGTRISPRFDCAPQLLVITADKSRRTTGQSAELSIQHLDSRERIRLVEAQGVEVLICGGITNEELQQLQERAIDVIPWVTGQFGKALKLFLADRLVPGAILCPGGRVTQWGFCKHKRTPGQGGS